MLTTYYGCSALCRRAAVLIPGARDQRRTRSRGILLQMSLDICRNRRAILLVRPNMRAKIMKTSKWVAILLAVAVLTLLGVRVYVVQRGPPLSVWHTYVPHELRASELDAA